MVSCASCGTSKSKATNVTFHNFPKDAHRRKAWINFVKKPGWEPKCSSVLCSLHFAEKCFDRTSLLKVRLSSTAFPTIEVERLKYVRSYNPMRTRVTEDEQKLTEEKEIQGSGHISNLSRPSIPLCILSSVSINASLQNNFHKKYLETKISELQDNNNLKSKRVRSLQKVTWRQRGKISSLKCLMIQLKKKNLLFEKRKDFLLKNFEKKLLNVSFKKQKSS